MHTYIKYGEYVFTIQIGRGKGQALIGFHFVS